DARYLAAGDQLAGEGSWFAVAAKWTDTYDPRSTYWRLIVYQPTGDNQYAPVWSQELVGVSGQGSGIVTADFTGDGQKEIAICAMPDLYVFQRMDGGGFQPIWYSSCGFMYRPFIGDLHGDGLVEIALNGSDSLVILQRADSGEAPLPPSGLVARPLDIDRVFLEWMPVSGAASYKLYRGESYYDLILRENEILTTTYLDSGLVQDTTYYYAVTTVDSLGRESHFYSTVVSAMPNEPPQMVSADVLTPGHIGVMFSESMGPSAQVTSHYWIDGGVGWPSSVILDRMGRRALLSLSSQLESEILYTVQAGNIYDETGVPISAGAQTATFILPPDTLMQPLYIRRIKLLERTSLDVLFSDSVDLSSAEEVSHYGIDPFLEVKEARV
ncbi:fibronectin type III domain-containing protein, partial [bacterium]|nr:fibronectin type III domain-containing protein [bacterium]